MDPNLLDIIIILTMLVSGLLALTQGFIKEILSLMGWIVSFVSVILLMPEAGNYLKPFSKPKRLAHSSSKLFTVGSSIYSSSPSSASKALSRISLEGFVTVSDLKSNIKVLP